MKIYPYFSSFSDFGLFRLVSLYEDFQIYNNPFGGCCLSPFPITEWPPFVLSSHILGFSPKDALSICRIFSRFDPADYLSALDFVLQLHCAFGVRLPALSSLPCSETSPWRQV